MKKLTLAMAAALALSATAAHARDNIEIVGSSTVYPFSTSVAETFAKKTGNAAPKVEATGTGGGFKLFCSGAGIDTPDVTNASRRMKKANWMIASKMALIKSLKFKLASTALRLLTPKARLIMT